MLKFSSGDKTGINGQDDRRFFVTASLVFIALMLLSSMAIYYNYQSTLDKNRGLIQEVVGIKSDIIQLVIENSSEYDSTQTEQGLKKLLFNQLSMYGVSEFVDVVYISPRANNLFYLFHKEGKDAYPVLKIKNLSELDHISIQAIKNNQSEITGLDYLGDEAFAYASNIKGSNWYVIAKVSKKNIQGPFIFKVLNISAVVIIILALSFFFFRKINRRHIEKIKQTAERTSALIGTSSNVIYTLNCENYCLTYISENIEGITGFSAEETMGDANHWVKRVHTEDIPKVKSGMALLYKNGHVVFEYRYRNKLDEYIWIQDTVKILKNDNDGIVEIIGCWTDVTNIKRSEEEISTQKDYSEHLLQNLSAPVFIIDANHIVLFWNKACEELTGLPAEKVVGTSNHWRGFYRLKRPCLSDVYIDQLSAKEIYINHKKSCIDHQGLHGENWCTVYGGRRLYLSIDIGPVFDKDGNLIAVVETVHDMTKHRNLETELIDARDKAIEATKTKSQFLANMSHEIRTPMNGVLGMLSLLKETGLNKEQKELTSTAFYSAESLLDIINEILDFSKLDAGQLKTEFIRFNLHKLLSDIERLFVYKTNDKNIEFICSFDENLPNHVYGDSTRVRQILINLLGNAVKFTEQGSIKFKVTIDAQKDKGINIEFEIEDTGIGIPLNKQHILFDEFSQVDASTTRNFGGTGLGLAITKKILELLSGCIEVQSESGKGSIFKILIPFEIAESQEESAQPDNVVSIPAKTDIDFSQLSPLSILVVEDNKVNQMVISGLLKKMTLTADVVENGKQAVEKVKQGNYQLVFMDCQMPIMDGYEATRAIRQYEEKQGNGHVLIIAMTANAMQGDREKCLAAGMDDYLAKPVNEKELQQTLYRWLSKNDKQDKEVRTMSDASDADTAPIVDIKALEGLRTIMEDEFNDVLQIYLEESVSIMSDIHVGFSEGSDTLLRSLHTLKSSSKNVGAMYLGDIAESMETFLKMNDIEAAKANLDELQEVFTRTHSQIKEYAQGDAKVVGL